MIRRLTRWLVLSVALVALAGALIYSRQSIQNQANRPPPPGGMAETQVPDVEVVAVSPGRYEARVDGYGEAVAHFELTLTAQVSGQVTNLSDDFEPGHRMDTGALLLELEDSDYRAALASSELDLANARVGLLEEERQGAQAKAEWDASGLRGKPDSDLVLRRPQLAAARATLANAEAALASARKDLDRTRVVAPFDAVVVERHVAPGSYLQAGAEVATLYSTDRVEIAVSLSARDWSSLPDTGILTAGRWPAVLVGVEDGQHWSGRVRRVESHRDDTTRQRALVVAVDRPLSQSPPLLPGTFLQVQLAGRVLNNLWKLPSAALSQRGKIWYLKDDNTLASFVGEPLFTDADSIFVSVPAALAERPQRVLVHPLNGYLQGMEVHPVEAPGDA